ncbi:MAG TPA: ArsR family transcriptional regulator [Edaphocola sp.]|nr:ArsR family transcriptional regulator [Edaphocola sp.]
MQKILNERKKGLIESLGIYLEKDKKVSPMAARILSTLILSCDNGTTFEKLVHDLEASKSTISTHLTNLESQNIISYFTKCGDRKRYYIIKPGYISRKISLLEEQWKTEIDLHKKVLEYKRSYNQQCENKEDFLPTTFQEQSLQFLENTLEYLEEQLNIFKTIEK